MNNRRSTLLSAAALLALAGHSSAQFPNGVNDGPRSPVSVKPERVRKLTKSEKKAAKRARQLQRVAP